MIRISVLSIWHWRQLWLWLALSTYLLLACYQLGLPGLHYDEAREAGLNAMELLTGAPVTPFRDVAIPFFGRRLPLMVQDYIGALNVYLALPVLWASGIGVPNLRIVAIFTGLLTLLLVERTVSSWYCFINRDHAATAYPSSALSPSISLPGLLAVIFLAASPSFIFWSRQGIFVTNLTQPLTFWCIWQGLRWLHTGRRRSFLASAFAGGCALYAKLLAIWVVGPFALLAGGWWVWKRWRRQSAPALSRTLVLQAMLAFILPLTPLLLFNWQSGGTWQAVAGNLGTSYYGVANWALGANLAIRSRQLLQTLQGNHLWYLGGLYGNTLAPWLTLALLPLGLWRHHRLLLGPLLLLLTAFAASLVTISDLFITHYALLQPLLLAIIALALVAAVKIGAHHFTAYRRRRLVLTAFVLVWVLFDLIATMRYHATLTRSGGLADHSDVSYHLAYHLQYNGLGAPITLDWGFDAPVRYLTQGAVTPIEIFGYSSPTAPDPDFAQRLQRFLGNPANIYLLHTPAATIFQGRREQFFAAIQQGGRQAHLETTFAQRDGTPVVELWRVLPP